MKKFDFLKKIETTLLKESNLPLTPKKSEWERINKNGTVSIFREYTFENYEQLMFFVQKSMKYSYKINHFPSFEINDESVIVDTTTHNLNDVTEQDLRIAKTFDQLYKDSISIFKRNETKDNVNDNDERHTEGYHFDWTNRW